MITDKILAIQVLCMPAFANPNGDIFGGWLLSQMDLAGAVLSQQIAQNRVVTVALDKMAFVKPVFIGDVLKCYATVERVGNTSITVLVEAYRSSFSSKEEEKVTEGKFTYVSIDSNRKPQKINV